MLMVLTACSTYYGFCGNAVAQQEDLAGSELKAQVCNKWLHPIDMREHPAFATWVIYGAPLPHWQFWWFPSLGILA